jgi:hypothetical protein
LWRGLAKGFDGRCCLSARSSRHSSIKACLPRPLALPSIAGAFSASADETLSINVAFATAYYLAILVTPWIQIRFGPKRHYVASLLGVFGATSR